LAAFAVDVFAVGAAFRGAAFFEAFTGVFFTAFFAVFAMVD
jgi:hypothetical protein